ncbi:MAG: methionyl-tRNA formyltransferase [Chloroflexi bacterium]|nr:methionyl-tRNA formyltransferase [Chloroflexota bacterium]
MSRIVFMGTPEFAVPVLEALTRTPHDIVGVFTQPDRPAGRGMRLQASPVKEFAEAHGFAVFQPMTLRKSAAAAPLESAGSGTPLRDLSPDLAIVAAYGLILPADILAIPRLGCVNTHASLLPRHRGAAPIMAAILMGDSETGVTLMQMQAGLDTGPILAQKAIPISPDDTTGTLTTKLSHLAADLVIETLPRILSGSIVPRPQEQAQATLFKTIGKEEGLIDWTRTAVEIERRVRAFNPWPSAFTFWQNRQLKILRAQALAGRQSTAPGQVVQTPEGVAVGTGEGVLLLKEVQLAGKNAMKSEDFVRGQKSFVGAELGRR